MAQGSYTRAQPTDTPVGSSLSLELLHTSAGTSTVHCAKQLPASLLSPLSTFDAKEDKQDGTLFIQLLLLCFGYSSPSSGLESDKVLLPRAIL